MVITGDPVEDAKMAAMVAGFRMIEEAGKRAVEENVDMEVDDDPEENRQENSLDKLSRLTAELYTLADVLEGELQGIKKSGIACEVEAKDLFLLLSKVPTFGTVEVRVKVRGGEALLCLTSKGGERNLLYGRSGGNDE